MLDLPGGPLKFSYVVSNPSSYMYLNDKRTTDGGRRWAKPDSCSKYNRYHYGLDRRNRYMSAHPASTLVQNYARRKVAYFLGKTDTGTSALDQGCRANLQGRHRYERGYNMMHFMNRFFGRSKHQLFEASVGHSATDMFTSRVGAALLTKY